MSFESMKGPFVCIEYYISFNKYLLSGKIKSNREYIKRENLRENLKKQS